MKKRLTIYDIKRLSNKKAPYFFSRKTLKFFNQTMKSFKVYKQKNGTYLIFAPSVNGMITKRIFNPKNNALSAID